VQYSIHCTTVLHLHSYCSAYSLPLKFTILNASNPLHMESLLVVKISFSVITPYICSYIRPQLTSTRTLSNQKIHPVNQSSHWMVKYLKLWFNSARRPFMSCITAPNPDPVLYYRIPSSSTVIVHIRNKRRILKDAALEEERQITLSWVRRRKSSGCRRPGRTLERPERRRLHPCCRPPPPLPPRGRTSGGGWAWSGPPPWAGRGWRSATPAPPGDCPTQAGSSSGTFAPPRLTCLRRPLCCHPATGTAPSLSIW
jgi:hypothetical protein